MTFSDLTFYTGIFITAVILLIWAVIALHFQATL